MRFNKRAAPNHCDQRTKVTVPSMIEINLVICTSDVSKTRIDTTKNTVKLYKQN